MTRKRPPSPVIGEARLLDRPGKCRSCGDGAYSVRQLNLHPDQAFRCYMCYDRTKYGNIDQR